MNENQTFKSSTVNKDMVWYLFFLGGMITLFFWPMLFQNQGYYYGDYKQQFYPWAFYLDRHLKAFSLPLWAPEIGCGFPLLAEGQIAVFYPLNWLLFLPLLFPFSYHAGFLILFFIVALFTYLFARKHGLSGWGAALASIVFLFGSSYGGLFYGLPAFRSLACFPVALYLIAALFESPRRSLVIFLAFVWASSFLGGFPQMACYVLFASLIYFVYRLFSAALDTRFVCVKYFLASVLLGIGLSACQLLPTLELVSQSTRAEASLDFALQKSFNPLNFAALVWPGFGLFLGFDFYAGILPLCLAVLAVAEAPRKKSALFFAAFGLFFMLLALGRYNPVYVEVLKWSHFYFFRVPFKFLFFASFALAMLAGMGLDLLISGGQKSWERFGRFSIAVFGGALFVFAAAHVISRVFKEELLSWAGRFVITHVYGKAGHPHSLESYLEKLPQYFNFLLERTRFNEPLFLITLSVWLGVFLFVLAKNRFFSNRKAWLALVMVLTIADLYFYYAFLGTGFRGNRVSPEIVASDEITSYLAKQEGLFRTYEAVTDPVRGAPRWPANSNMLFNYSSIGLYSPLAVSAYREYLKKLGGVDNSTGVYPASKNSIAESLSLLNLMNVRYVLSREDLDGLEGFSKVMVSSSGDILYENKNYLPRVFVTKQAAIDEKKGEAALLDANPKADLESKVEWVRYESDRLVLNVNVPQPSFLFLSELFYPGWRAKIDGETAKIYKTNTTFKGLQIPGGAHSVELRYEPESFRTGMMVSLMSLYLMAFFIFVRGSRTAQGSPKGSRA